MSSPEEKFDRDVATALRELVPEPPAAVDLMDTVAARVRRRRRVRAGVAATASAVAVVAVGVIPAVLLTGGSTNGQPAVAPAPPRPAAAPDCPAGPPFNALRTPHRPGTSSTLVPPTPTVASVCDVEATATRAVVLRGDELTALVAALDTLPPVHSQICSAVPGPHIRLVFGYGSGPELLVDTAPAGCYATNGVKEVSLNTAVDTRLAAYLDHPTDGTSRPLVTAGACAGLTVQLTYHGQSHDAAPLPDSTAVVLDVGDDLTLRATGACEEQVGYDPDDPPMLRPTKQGVGTTDPRRIVLTASTPGHETVNITVPSCADIPPSTTPCVGGLGVIGRIDVLVQPAGAASGVTVPNVVGEPGDDARHALTAASFTVQTTAVPTDGGPAGTVVAQRPAAGTRAAARSMVALSVASGPPGSATSASTADGSPSCNWFSAAESDTGRQVTARYGEIRNCLRLGTTWIMTTLGSKTQTGVIGLYRCAAGDSTCLDGNTAHPFANWHWYPPPQHGGVTYQGQEGPNAVLLSVGGSSYTFELTTARYTICCLRTRQPAP